MAARGRLLGKLARGSHLFHRIRLKATCQTSNVRSANNGEDCALHHGARQPPRRSAPAHKQKQHRRRPAASNRRSLTTRRRPPDRRTNRTRRTGSQDGGKPPKPPRAACGRRRTASRPEWCAFGAIRIQPGRPDPGGHVVRPRTSPGDYAPVRSERDRREFSGLPQTDG